MIDITKIANNKMKFNNIIYIPSGEHNRSLYFSDPCFGKIKSIFITKEKGVVTSYDPTKKLFIDTNNECVYTDILPKHIKDIFYENNVISLDYNLIKIINKYYNESIQTSKKVINDIAFNCTKKKMLVFGLGYDSELWYNLTNKNTYFVEDKLEYIDLNKNINSENIIYHQYKDINVKKSFKLDDSFLKTIKIPDKLMKLSPFDIIYIDGPEGCTKNSPGRRLPFYWSKNILSKKGSLIYVDDIARLLESYCIHKYFGSNNKKFIDENIPCIKIII